MAATVIINEWNGTSGSQAATDKTSGTSRFKKADNATVDLNNPLVKPASGSDWSFQKFYRGKITVAPAGNITNPKFYMSGAAATGQSLWIKTTNPSAYATPAQESASTGYTDAFTYTSGSPKALDTVNAGPYTSTGDFADFWEMAMSIDNTVAAPGTLAAKTMTLQWDET